MHTRKILLSFIHPYRIKSKAGLGSITTRDGPGPGEYKAKEYYAKIRGAATFTRYKRMEINSKGTDGEVGPASYKTNYKVLTRNEP